MRYYYGMRLRGFSLGCQPMDGFIERQDDNGEEPRYYDIIVYDRKLSDEECRNYELDYLTQMIDHKDFEEALQKQMADSLPEQLKIQLD